MLRENLERELENWARWLLGGGWCEVWSSASISPVYASESVRNRESKVPVLAGAAADVDAIVTGLSAERQAVLRAEYLRADARGRRLPLSFTQGQIARALGVSRRTYQYRLEEARQAVGDGLSERRRRSAALRAQAGGP